MSEKHDERRSFPSDSVDILYERRGTSDLMWASRPWSPTVAYKQPYRLNGDEIKSIVLHSPFLRHVIHKIHLKQSVPFHIVYQNAEIILKEIGLNRRMTVIRWFAVFISKLLKKLYSGVFVNEVKLLEIKSQMGNNPVLFIPSHKSYCDFVLMAYVCFHYEIDIPRIAAGMDFQSMAIIGSLLRDSCAFFLRRSFNNDELYSSIFSQYVHTLVTDGDGPVEFFIEGTRSRTAKSLFPKFGLLSMALKPFFIGQVPDVTVVPVTLNYDKILEEVLFAYELLGVPKPKESTKGFIKALSVLNENHGSVYVKFGDPISMKDFCCNNIDRSIHNSGPIHLQKLSPNENKQIIRLAHTVVTKQRELIVLNCFNLIAFILNNNIISAHDPPNLDELTREVDWLFYVLKVLCPNKSGFAMSCITQDDIMHHLAIHKPFIFICENKKIRIGKMFAPNSELDPKQLKGHTLAPSTLDVALPLVMLQNYVNPCTYFFVPVSFLALILQTYSRERKLLLDELFEEFKFLCSVFAYEFVFYEDFIEMEFKKCLAQSQSLKLVDINENSVNDGENIKLRSTCINFLRPFIPGYKIVAETLLESASHSLPEPELIKLCQKNVEAEFRRQMIIHPNNLSLDALKNALQSYVSMKVVSKVKGNSLTYRVDETKTRHLCTKLCVYDTSAKCGRNNYVVQFSNFTKSNL